MSEKRILVWFRNDLRLHDNEMLFEAVQKADLILPIFLFDPRNFGPTSYKTQKTGIVRANFLLESVEDLRNSFRERGGDLLVLNGHPELLIPQIAEQYGISEVYHHREVAPEETSISSLTEDALWKLKINLRHFIGHTLYNKEDLPFPIKDIPDSFSRFKKKTEREATVKQSLEAPSDMRFIALDDAGALPKPSDLSQQEKSSYAQKVKGGETAALNYLGSVATGGHELVDATTSAGLSAWLAMGCISPRKIYWEGTLRNNKTLFSKIMLGLLWRDYFRFMFKKHGNGFFKPRGFSEKLPYAVKSDDTALENWKSGNTGELVVDRLMEQLRATGYLDAQERNLVLTYFIEIMQLDWTLGAAYFEEMLIDYAPASNWGNWAVYAGVGNDPAQKRLPNFATQVSNYLKQGQFAA